MTKLFFVLLLVVVPVTAQTFNTTSTLPAPMTDNPSFCVASAETILNVPVAGTVGVTSVSINFTMSPAHTWYGDIHCRITNPAGATVVAMANSCDGSVDDSSDVSGAYTLTDGAVPSFDAAATAAGAVIPPGTYGPDNTMSGLVACGANGTWVVAFSDGVGGDIGTIAALSLTFGVAPPVGESFTICQTGAGAPVNLIHFGTPNAIYINPVMVNTPAAVPNGWAFGLAIPWTQFLDEVNTTGALAPIFHGTLIGGASLVSVPGVPAGWTLQIVGVHFDPVTGQPTFGSTATSFSVL